MKLALLTTLIFMAACSSNKTQAPTIPVFEKEKVCSDEALVYFKNKKTWPVAKKVYSDAEIHQRLLNLTPAIQSCYEKDIARTNKPESFNLCFVGGYNPKGEVEFFEFSTNEISLPTEFKDCLEKIKGSEELKGLKSLSILQPYRLYPKSY